MKRFQVNITYQKILRLVYGAVLRQVLGRGVTTEEVLMIAARETSALIHS